MKRTVQAAAATAFAAALVASGAQAAQASSHYYGDDPVISTYSVPASEMATESTWTSERMQAALPGDLLVADTAASFDFDSSDVEVGQPSTFEAAESAGDIELLAYETPVSHIGKVFFTLGGKDYVCSANSVASDNGNTVATAGHCLHEGPGEYATEFTFVPGYENGDAPYGQWAATELFASAEWVESGDMNYDAAFAVVESPTGDTLAETVGASDIAFNQSTEGYYSLFGYPKAEPFDGETLQSCYGYAMEDIMSSSTTQGVRCDLTGGSSGGPWFLGEGSDGAQNSVNSYSYRFLPGVMWGPYFGDVVESVYMEAQA